MILYKYCPVNDYTLENFEKSQLFFNAPKAFNDPYEGIFNIRTQNNTLAKEYLKKMYQHKYQELIKRNSSINECIEHTRFSYINQ